MGKICQSHAAKTTFRNRRLQTRKTAPQIAAAAMEKRSETRRSPNIPNHTEKSFIKPSPKNHLCV